MVVTPSLTAGPAWPACLPLESGPIAATARVICSGGRHRPVLGNGPGTYYGHTLSTVSIHLSGGFSVSVGPHPVSYPLGRRVPPPGTDFGRTVIMRSWWTSRPRPIALDHRSCGRPRGSRADCRAPA